MMRRCEVLLLSWLLLTWTTSLGAQESLAKLPGYANYERIREGSRGLGAAGRATATQWAEDGTTLTFRRDGKLWRINLQDFAIQPVEAAETPPADDQRGRRTRGEDVMRERVGRAAQSTWVRSPTGQWMARYRNFNVVLEKIVEPAPPATDAPSPAAGESPAPQPEPAQPAPAPEPEIRAVTTSGSELFRYGTACWVYGEELFQDTAMWWSPDGQKLAFYEIDERHLQNYYLTLANTETFTTLQVERYPKAGMPNPFVGLLVYDLASGLTTRVDVG
ncbi:MAG: DPP IV N-terminal domain-containing protein, partial [Pirellulaceae bacterium]|nr:DPP IV N-terminal domain-containing protein [Pirellulaceae bacterium]